MDELDEDGYPTEELLETIRNWPWQQGFNGLMELVKRNWNWSDMMFCKEEDTYSISTGGWSGNESLVHAMQENQMFWGLCWVSSRRGGHYEFEVPEAFQNQQKETL
jgi:hypothetical protein